MKNIIHYYEKIKIKTKILKETKTFLGKLLITKKKSLNELEELYNSFLNNNKLTTNFKILMQKKLNKKLEKKEKKILIFGKILEKYKIKFFEFANLKKQIKNLLEKNNNKNENFLELINIINNFNKVNKDKSKFLTYNISKQTIESFVFSHLEKIISKINLFLKEIENEIFKFFDKKKNTKNNNSKICISEKELESVESLVQKVYIKDSSLFLQNFWESDSTSKINENKKKTKKNINYDLKKKKNYENNNISNFENINYTNNFFSINSVSKIESSFRDSESTSKINENQKNQNLKKNSISKISSNLDDLFSINNKLETPIKKNQKKKKIFKKLQNEKNFENKENIYFNKKRNNTPMKSKSDQNQFKKKRSCRKINKTQKFLTINLKQEYIKIKKETNGQNKLANFYQSDFK